MIFKVPQNAKASQRQPELEGSLTAKVLHGEGRSGSRLRVRQAWDETDLLPLEPPLPLPGHTLPFIRASQFNLRKTCPMQAGTLAAREPGKASVRHSKLLQ